MVPQTVGDSTKLCRNGCIRCLGEKTALLWLETIADSCCDTLLDLNNVVLYTYVIIP